MTERDLGALIGFIAGVCGTVFVGTMALWAWSVIAFMETMY